jgi:hypothetical protein
LPSIIKINAEHQLKYSVDNQGAINELFNRIIDLPFTTLVLEITLRFKTTLIFDPKVRSFADHVSSNKTSQGKFLAMPDSELSQITSLMSVQTTRMT